MSKIFKTEWTMATWATRESATYVGITSEQIGAIFAALE